MGRAEGSPVMLCPNCDSLLVEQQPSTSLLDGFSSLFSIHPFQCRSCKYRFRAVVNVREHRAAERTSIQIPVSFEWGEGRGEGVLADISNGSCALESKRRLKPGLILKLHFSAGTGGKMEQVTSQLATVRSVHGDRVGLKFLALTPHQQHQLTQTVTKCIRAGYQE